MNTARRTVIAVGVDVSKDKVDICLRSDDGSHTAHTVANSRPALSEFTNRYLPAYEGKLVLESTGRYHLLPALMFADKGLDVYVINPLISKRYMSATIRKVKSDTADAKVLADIAVMESNLPPSFSSDKKRLYIRKKLTLLSALEKQIQRMTAVLSDFDKTLSDIGYTMSDEEASLTGILTDLKKKKGRIEREVEKEIEGEDRSEINQLSSIPGVSTFMASVAVETFINNQFGCAKQWIAFLGFDVSVRQSGKWVGKGRLTKRGNPYMRKRFFSAAWGAVMNNEEFKKYYDHLREAGHNYVETIVIIARKLIRIMFAVLTKKTAFDPSIQLVPVS
jgi:transposase